MIMACGDWLEILSQAWSQGRLTTVSCIVGRLAPIADASSSPIAIIFLAPSRIVDVRVFGIDLNSLVVGAPTLTSARERGLGKFQTV